MEDHAQEKALREYSLGELAQDDIARIEEHLQNCDFCRALLTKLEPINYVHFTADGPVYSRVTRLTTRKVMARHWGKEMDGGMVFTSVSSARRYLSESFAQMFPEHRCDRTCGPTPTRGHLWGG